MSDVLTAWERPVLIKTVTTTAVDFEPVETVAGRTQDCVVQVAEKERLNPDTIDWTLEYLMVHSKSGIEQGEYIEFDGRDYRLSSADHGADTGTLRWLPRKRNGPFWR